MSSQGPVVFLLRVRSCHLRIMITQRPRVSASLGANNDSSYRYQLGMSPSDKILPPLPKREPWNPKLSDDDLFAKPGERRRTNEDLRLITSILESAGVTCCFVGVMALRHFGAKRISLVCHPLLKQRRTDINIHRTWTSVFQALNWMTRERRF